MRRAHPLVTASVTALSLAAACAAAAVNPPAADDAWARVEMDRDTLTAWLGPVAGVDYGAFQWIPAHLLATRAPVDPARVTVIEAPFRITLGGESFDPADRPLTFAGRESTAATGPGWWLVQFVGPTRRDWLGDLTARGLKPVQYIHPFTYVTWGEAATVASLQEAGLPQVRAVSEFRPDYKFRPDEGFPPAVGHQREMMALVANEYVPTLQGRMGAVGAAIRAITAVNSLLSVIYLSATGIRGGEIAEFPEVYALQDVPMDGGVRGEIQNQVNAGQLDASGRAHTGYLAWLDGTGHDGSTVTVSVVDESGFRASHLDLADNVSGCVPLPGPLSSCSGNAYSDHATHVAGAIAGTGASGIVDGEGFLRGIGVAPGARIVAQDFVPLLSYEEGGMVPDGMSVIFTEAVRSGALISNHSWGPSSTARGYDIPTLQVDIGTRDADPATTKNEPLLAVWAIMNGQGDRMTGPCAPASLGSPDEAKNILAVGATYLLDGAGQRAGEFDRLAHVSAHGNACDGRRVPHLVAPGCTTDNASAAGDRSHSRASSFCGTSMAAPNVSGAAALFSAQHYARTRMPPSPALVKAALTAVAHDLAGQRNANTQGEVVMGHRPDRFQGFGRLDLDAAVNPAAEVIHVDQTHVFHESGEEWLLQVEADDPDLPVQVMLAWTDAPGHGLGGATAAWVNDLDLRVRAGAHAFRGNAVGADGWSSAGGVPDGANNLEGVFLSPAQHGGDVLEIAVLATNIAGDALAPRNPQLAGPRQDFALACYNCTTRIDAKSTAVDLALQAPSTTPVVTPGGTVALPFSIVQPGPGKTQKLRVDLELPEGLWHVRRSDNGAWECVGGGRHVRCTTAADAMPGTVTAGDVLVRAHADLQPGRLLSGVARVRARDNSDPAGSNNAVTIAVQVMPLQDLLLVDGFEGGGPH
ncbi:S8 family serine peptidase [Pseudofulvimonas gallinarii]|uniref:Subtilase family protein n=1 Tax=Pseudofulvimonas gallinarii TaxID=634155 RepID=A0A4R3LHR5_9GAMM|nr:S8 family serine peptidase [Pseudofulvimonas gallinarii]TCS97984.1 subtilase family protein [Pseudofulvimonas gallinarii]